MKITLTIELIALLTFIIGWGVDIENRYGYYSSDDGWTTTYHYTPWARKFAYRASIIAEIIAIIGILWLIWD